MDPFLPRLVINLEQAKESFLLAWQVSGRAPKTITLYRMCIDQLISFAGDQALETISTGDLRRFVAHLQSHLAPATVSIRYRAIHAFFNWLEGEGLLTENPMKRLSVPKVPRIYPYVLTSIQLESLLFQAKRSKRSWYGLRDYTAVLTLLDTGLRVGELLALTLNDVDLIHRSFRVLGKGSKERTVYFGQRVARAIKTWLHRRTMALAGDFLFCTRSGWPLNRHNLHRTMRRLADKAGLQGIKASPHVLRHSFATEFIRNGGDPFTLQRLLGHSHIETTMVYVHMVGRTLREAHAKASPVDRILD